MRNTLTIALTACLIGISTLAFADPPADSPGNAPEKSTILHCGCGAAGEDLQYVEINISSKSRGHDEHFVGTIDSCFDGVDSYTDFVRTGSDCQLSGPPLGDPIEACDGQLEFDDCGEAVVD